MDVGRRTFNLRLGILFFTAGVLAVCALPQLPPLHWLAVGVIPALLPWRFRAHYAMAVLGVLLMVWRGQTLLDERWSATRYGEEVWVTGHIAALPEFTRKSDEVDVSAPVSGNWRFLFETHQADVPPRLRVSWYRTEQVLKGGECWRLQLRLKPPHGSANPGGFDYEGWLFRQGIGATASVRAAQRCDDDTHAPLLSLRQALSDRVDAMLPASSGRALLKALTFGDTRELTDEDWQVFRVTGTTHLVAISGFNIALVAGIAFFIFRWLWVLWPRLCLWLPAQKAALIGAVLIAFVYALLSGWEPPVQRAFLMLLFIAMAGWLHRLHLPSSVLALAWWVILLFDPLAILSPGLWLSFAAVAAIFYLVSGRLQPVGWLRGLVMLQLLLSLALMPLTVYFFHGISWVSPLLNLIAVPIVSVLTPLLLLALLLSTVAPTIGLAFLQGMDTVLSFFHAGLLWLTLNVPHLWTPFDAAPAVLLLATFGALLLFVPRGVPLRALGVLCFLPLLLPRNTAPQEGFELTALDVGQGLSVVVRTAQHTLLFDTGPAFEDGFDAGESIVAPYLLSQGVTTLDRLIISHGDNDHSGGAPAIRRMLNVESELGALTPTPCREGQRWDWDGVRFEILHPDDAKYSSNNSGCVLRIEAGSYAALLPADIEKVAERRLLQDQLVSLQADVLLSAHHGSKTSSTEDFIDAVQPRIVIHSAGWHSQFHHPHPSVVARYRAAGVQQWVTGWQGAVQLHITDKGVGAPTAWREQRRHFWQMPSESLSP